MPVLTNNKNTVPTWAIPVAGAAASYTSALAIGKVLTNLQHDGLRDTDEYISKLARKGTNSALDNAMALMSGLGEPNTLYPVAAVVCVRWLAKGKKAESSAVAASLFGSAILNKLVKSSVNRPRPRFTIAHQRASGSSFPSSHTTMSLATYGTIAAIIRIGQREKSRNDHKQTSAPVLLPVGLMCGLIGWSRVYEEVHRPTDVVSGWIVGGIWMAACLRLYDRLARKQRAEQKPERQSPQVAPHDPKSTPVAIAPALESATTQP